MKKSLLYLFYICFFSHFLSAQPTIGVLQNDSGSLQGYTFFSPFSGTKAYLVDNCGQLVNEWDRGTRPGLAAYFLENGLMFRTFKPPLNGPFTSASNAGGLELVDWNNETIWSYQINTATELSHHDAVYMPNGHFLVLTWELVYTDELVALGRDPNEIAQEGYMWSEKILELEPVGNNEANIIWEWQIKDHYIQDFDSTKAGFGVIAEHPELFNINLPELNSSNSNSTRDWNHFNAIDYNPELDQILISVRNSDEIWIIDHSTTTTEAASHTGGKYGKGGDILYRWGNASAYDQAPLSEQKLFGQHGVHWIKEGLKDAGKILIFNNGNGRPGPDFSVAEILTPPQDSIGGYLLPDNDPFGPEVSESVYGDQTGERDFSAFLSNAQRLSNGNTLLNYGSIGTIIEVDSQRNKVWEYIIPLSGDFPLNQGQSPNSNWSFRAYKFSENYPGFDGVSLSAGSIIELGGNPLNCEILVSNQELQQEAFHASLSYRMLDRIVKLSNPEGLSIQLSIHDLLGRNVLSQSIQQTDWQMMLPDSFKGMYFIRIRADHRQSVLSIISP